MNKVLGYIVPADKDSKADASFEVIGNLKDIYSSFEIDNEYIQKLDKFNSFFDHINTVFYKIVNMHREYKNNSKDPRTFNSEFQIIFFAFLESIQPYISGIENLFKAEFSDSAEKLIIYFKKLFNFIYDNFSAYGLIYQIRNSRQHKNELDITISNSIDSGLEVILSKKCLIDDKIIKPKFKEEYLIRFQERINLLEQIDTCFQAIREVNDRIFAEILDFKILFKYFDAVCKLLCKDKQLVIYSMNEYQEDGQNKLTMDLQYIIAGNVKEYIDKYFYIKVKYPTVKERIPYIKHFNDI